MDRKQEVLRQLREADGYVSGQQLCEALGVSRTAVWKIINRLKEDGYPIEAVTNKGYRLLSVEGRDLFNQEELERPQGTLAVTAKQTTGKGRRGRTWISPPGVNIYMSILLKPDFRPETAPMLTLVMAMSVFRACKELYGDECVFGIKWPNDIVVSARGGDYHKICGILTEMRMEEKEIRDIVIGIGINVNQMQFPEEISQTAGSLALALGREVSRADLTAAVWKYYEEYYERFAEAQTLKPLREEYESALVNRGRKVRVEGTAMGINDLGELLVQPEDGSSVRAVGTGEVSVRGVMGYV